MLKLQQKLIKTATKQEKVLMKRKVLYVDQTLKQKNKRTRLLSRKWYWDCPGMLPTFTDSETINLVEIRNFGLVLGSNKFLLHPKLPQKLDTKNYYLA